MKGTRPLTNDEIQAVADTFTGTYEVRNRGLFLLGVSVGGRISELLSLTVGDVYQNDQPVSDLLFDRKIVKGKEESRAVPVNIDGRDAIEAIIGWHHKQYGETDPQTPLFPSRKRSGGKLTAMNRQNSDKILNDAFTAAGLNGKLGTHSLRKSFAQRLYDVTRDIYVVKELLGHKNVVTTQDYLGVNYIKVREALEKMSLDSWRKGKHTSPLADVETVDLINELIARGYTVASLNREEKGG